MTLRIVLPQPSRRGQAGVGDLAHQLGRVGQRDVVHLDVLPRRDVALAQRHVLLDHVGERVELVGRDAAHRQLDADHLHVGLALAVDALLEAELDEVVLLELALEEARRLGVEVVELALEDRDHVPRDVLDHLRVLQRACRGARFLVVSSDAGSIGILPALGGWHVKCTKTLSESRLFPLVAGVPARHGCAVDGAACPWRAGRPPRTAVWASLGPALHVRLNRRRVRRVVVVLEQAAPTTSPGPCVRRLPLRGRRRAPADPSTGRADGAVGPVSPVAPVASPG